MTTQTSSNDDIDFEQMMGELDAMKSDLANKRANRSASRSTPRSAGDGTPRRERTRRGATDSPADPSLAVVVPSRSPRANGDNSVLSPATPAAQRSITFAPNEHDPPRPEMNHNQDQGSQGQDGQRQEIESSISQAETKVEATNQHVQSTDNGDPNGPQEGSGLVRTESRRNVAVPLPPKSAQRSRSISNTSTRLSHSSHQDIGEVNREITSPPSSQSGSPQENSTPTFSSNATPRQQNRPHPSSNVPLNGQQPSVTASPRLPARSNSRSKGKPVAAGSTSHPEQAHQNSPQAPIIPARSRSVSRSHSRNNTLTKFEGGQDHGNPYNGTPTIAEDQEDTASPQHEQKQYHQQSTPTPSDESQRSVMPSATQGAEHSRKQSISISSGSSGENQKRSSDPLEQSRLPADHTPPLATDPNNQQVSNAEADQQGVKPMLRKQTSTDPAALYKQHYNQSSAATSPYLESKDGGRSREASGDSQASVERGRMRKQEKQEEGSKGVFAWVRSRSKSKDARQNQEAPSVPEYNPALLPSRSGSLSGRAKSLPRKPSNQNLQGNNENWPPFPSLPGTSDGPSLQHSKSINKHGINPPPFSTPTSKDGSSLIPASFGTNTNLNTIHHEKMVRGMGMGGPVAAPAVLLTPQPTFASTPVLNQSANSPGGMRNVALAMMKQDGSPSSSEVQMQQRHQQLQQAQMLHIQQQQQRLAVTTTGLSPSSAAASPRNQQSASPNPLSPAATTPTTQRLVATRIYIQTESDFKSVNLAPNTTALEVLQMLQQRGTFGEPGDGRYHDRWTIFEFNKEFMVERPLRDFEVLLDVMKTWEADKDNKMICKSYPARNELSAGEVIRLIGPAGQASFVRPHGWAQVELKKGKWAKRYLHITDTAVYHSKDANFTGESMLCLLRNFDVYSVMIPRKKSPTKFGFALKSTDSIHMFETPEDDYIHYVCTDNGDQQREWIMALRAAKGMSLYHANPEVIREGQKREEMLSSGNKDGSARGNLTEEQVSIAEAKLAGLGVSFNSNVVGGRSR